MNAEVTEICSDRIWMLIDDRKFFLPYSEFPSFRDAPVNSITALDRPQPHHLRWPKLDVDLEVESIEDPARFPLVFHE